MPTWKEYKWGDLVTLEYGKSLSNYRDGIGKVPVYGTNGPIGFTEKPLCNYPSVIIGRKGAYRGVNYSNQPFFVIDTAFYIKPKAKDLDLKYTYYFLKTVDINSMDSGSAIPSTSREDFYELPARIPDLPTQTAIAEILSSLDDKIELNNQINQELEALAQALFKQWFIDFEFPDENGQPYKSSGGEMVESELGEIPKGWRVGKIIELFQLQRGHDLPTDSRVQGNVPVYSASGFHGYHNEAKAQAPGITTGRSGVIGKVFLILEDYWPLNTSLYVKQFKIASPYYTYFLLKEIDLLSLNAGSAVPTLNRNDVHNLNCIVPNKDVINSFTTSVKDNFEMIKINKDESEQIALLRNELLPKLISGELEVSEALTEAAM